MTTYLLIILFGGGLSAGGLHRIGLYSSKDSCEVARKILIDDKTPLSGSHVLCVPIDQETIQ